MTTTFTLIGQIAIGSGAEEQFEELLAILEPEDEDEITLEAGTLRFCLNEVEVPHSFAMPALKAIEAFCLTFATEAAVFDYGGGDELIFGPTAAMRKAAHIAYHEGLVEEAEMTLEMISCCPLDRYKEQFQ